MTVRFRNTYFFVRESVSEQRVEAIRSLTTTMEKEGDGGEKRYLELVNQYLVDELGLGSRFIGDSPAKGRRAVSVIGDVVRIVGLRTVTTAHLSATTAPSQCSTRYHLRHSCEMFRDIYSRPFDIRVGTFRRLPQDEQREYLKGERREIEREASKGHLGD